MHISSFLPRLGKHIFFTTFILSIQIVGDVEVPLLHTNCELLTSESKTSVQYADNLFAVCRNRKKKKKVSHDRLQRG